MHCTEKVLVASNLSIRKLTQSHEAAQELHAQQYAPVCVIPLYRQPVQCNRIQGKQEDTPGNGHPPACVCARARPCARVCCVRMCACVCVRACIFVHVHEHCVFV